MCPHCGCTVPVVAIEGRYWWVPASVPQLQAQLERAQAGADRLRTSMRAFAQMFEREAIEIRE